MIAHTIEEKHDYRVTYLQEKKRIRAKNATNARKERKKEMTQILKQKKEEELDLQLTLLVDYGKLRLK